MSTRCVIGFYSGHPKDGAPEALIYRHSDGYPDGKHGPPACLEQFFDAVIEQCGRDTRFGDPSYLAAKYVVWQAAQYNRDAGKPLAFLSVGVVQAAPGDVEYRYAVVCADGGIDRAKPSVYWTPARHEAWALAKGADTKDERPDD